MINKGRSLALADQETELMPPTDESPAVGPRAPALAHAVGLVTAHRNNLPAPEPAEPVDPEQVAGALTWLAGLLAEHAVRGEMVLQVAGRVAGWISAGGEGHLP